MLLARSASLGGLVFLLLSASGHLSGGTRSGLEGPLSASLKAAQGGSMEPPVASLLWDKPPRQTHKISVPLKR